MAGEASRLRRETDLKELEKLRARLADAEALRERHQRQRRDETGPAPSGLAGEGSGSELRPEENNADHDARDSAWRLLLSLRVEVATLRLMCETSTGKGVGEEERSGETSRAVREAREEVGSSL